MPRTPRVYGPPRDATPPRGSYRGGMADDTSKADATWGPYPGDALAPPPTPQAPEIPMSESWPWIAGAAVALRILLPIIVVLGVVLVIIGLIEGWF